jgi:hypothetical protein
MEAGRDFRGWIGGGALLGLLLPVVWLLLYGFLAPDAEGIDLNFQWLLGFFLLFLVYLVSGLGVLAAAVGAVCGWACAWLPRGLPLWLRRAVLLASLHLAPVLAYLANPKLPPGLINLPPS